MNSTKKNLAANFLGSILVGLIAFVFIPIYVKSVGPDGYGLIAFQTTLVATFALFDLGFGAAGVREMAKLSGQADHLAQTANLIFSLEVLYWGVAACLGLILCLMSPIISSQWLSSTSLDKSIIEASVQLMAIAFTFQFPIALYSGCLIGLQRQVGLNVTNILFSILRYGGAAVVVVVTKGDLEIFFVWQLAVAVLNVILLRHLLWRNIKPRRPLHFKITEIKSVWGFAIAMGGVNLLGLLLNQVDKLIISKLFTLEMFGYYTLAWTAASLISRIAIPVFNAVYPRMTQLYTQKDEKSLFEFYQSSAQTMALFIIPISIFLMTFSKEILSLWLRNPVTVDQVKDPASVLFLACMFSSLFLIPYGLRLSTGMTGTIIKANIISLVIFVPATIVLTLKYSQPAFAWLLLNAMAVLVVNYFYLRGILKKALTEWFVYALIIPCLFCVVYFQICKRLFGGLEIQSEGLVMLILFFIGAAGFIGTAFTLPKTRQSLIKMLKVAQGLN